MHPWLAGVKVPGPFGTRMIMTVPGSCGGSGGIICEGTPQFLVAVCGCEQRGRLVDGYEVCRGVGSLERYDYRSQTQWDFPNMRGFANHGVGGLHSIKGGFGMVEAAIRFTLRKVTHRIETEALAQTGS
jgi:hypothetical protein